MSKEWSISTTQKNLIYSALVLVIAGSGPIAPLSVLLWFVHPIVTATMFAKDKKVSGKIGHSAGAFFMSLTAIVLGIGFGSMINPAAYETSSATQNNTENAESSQVEAVEATNSESSEAQVQSADQEEGESKSEETEASTTFRFSREYPISNMYLRKVEDATARSGYVFQFVGDIMNDGNKELTVAESVGASVGVCIIAHVNDEHDRKFDASCEIPAMLPGEAIQNVVLAQSTAMPDSTRARLCLGPANCSSWLTAR